MDNFNLIYFSGVIVMLLISFQSHQDDDKITVADLIDTIVYAGLSWVTFVFVATQYLTDWMRRTRRDKTLFTIKKNYKG